MKESGAKDGGKDVDQDACHIAGKLCDSSENFLGHGIIRADIKHVDRAKRVKKYVKAGGQTTAVQIEKCGSYPTFFGVIGYFAQSSCEAEDDQQNMPCKGVDSKRKKRIVHSAGVKKCEDSSQKTIIHEKCKDHVLVFLRVNPGNDQT